MSKVSDEPTVRDSLEGPWVSVNAVSWVLDHAPNLPAPLVGTLIAVARHAGPDGRNAFPSMASLAAMTRKSERQVRRDLGELQKLGLLLSGDATAAGRLSRIPPQYRPHVFDLPLWLRRGDTDDTSRGDVDVPPGSQARGDVDDRSRGDMDDRSEGTSMVARGDTHVPLIRREQPSKNPVEEEASPPLAALASSGTTPDDKRAARNKKSAQQLAEARRLIAEHTDAHSDHDADRLIARLETEYGRKIGNPAAYITEIVNDDPDRLQDHLDAARDHLADRLIEWMTDRQHLNGQTGHFQTLAFMAASQGHPEAEYFDRLARYGACTPHAMAGAWEVALGELAGVVETWDEQVE